MTYEAENFYDRIEDGDEKAWADAILIGEPVGLTKLSRYIRGVEFKDHSYLTETKDGETEWGPDISKIKL